MRGEGGGVQAEFEPNPKLFLLLIASLNQITADLENYAQVNTFVSMDFLPRLMARD